MNSQPKQLPSLKGICSPTAKCLFHHLADASNCSCSHYPQLIWWAQNLIAQSPAIHAEFCGEKISCSWEKLTQICRKIHYDHNNPPAHLRRWGLMTRSFLTFAYLRRASLWGPDPCPPRWQPSFSRRLPRNFQYQHDHQHLRMYILL